MPISDQKHPIDLHLNWIYSSALLSRRAMFQESGSHSGFCYRNTHHLHCLESIYFYYSYPFSFLFFLKQIICLKLWDTFSMLKRKRTVVKYLSYSLTPTLLFQCPRAMFQESKSALNWHCFAWSGFFLMQEVPHCRSSALWNEERTYT